MKSTDARRLPDRGQLYNGFMFPGLMYPYDGDLLAAVSTPPASIADVLAAMQAIDSLCVDGDGLKWFNHLYLQVTESVKVRVAQQGFADPEWLAELDVQFAGLYFDALRGALASRTASGCWRALFDRRNQTAVARIQFAMAGVNAHINHDLPVAIMATCRATGTIPSHAGLHYADYTAMNATLEALVDSAKRELHVRLLGDALPPVSHLEDTLAAFSVTAAREAAWDNAEMLWALRSFPLLASRALSTLDGLTTLAGKSLLVPVPMVKALTA